MGSGASGCAERPGLVCTGSPLLIRNLGGCPGGQEDSALPTGSWLSGGPGAHGRKAQGRGVGPLPECPTWSKVESLSGPQLPSGTHGRNRGVPHC